jgi:beta-glucosidase
VVQVYVQDVQSSLVRPQKELKAFKKVSLKPGETKNVSFTLDKDALSYYDDNKKQWVAEPGTFNVLVGASSKDIKSTVSFELK